MKQKHAEMPAYLLLSVFAVILTGILIYCTKNFYDNTANAADNVIEDTKEFVSDYADYDIKMYDGERVRGSEVVNFIKKYLGDYDSSETAPVYVQVKTVNNGVLYTNTYVNNVRTGDIKNFSSTEFYIKPTASFDGKIIKSANEAILGICFTQK